MATSSCISRDVVRVMGGTTLECCSFIRPVENVSCSSCKSYRKLVVLAATGFGRQAQTKSKPRTLKELDFKSVEKTETYKIYVRKVAVGEALPAWENLGVILVEPGADVELAMKERRDALGAAVNHQYPAFRILGDGETLQYGVQLDTSPPPPADEAAAENAEVNAKADEAATEDTDLDITAKSDEAEAQSEKPVEEAAVPAEVPAEVPVEEAAEIVPLDLSGKLPDDTVAATTCMMFHRIDKNLCILSRAEDGKVSGRRYKRRFF